VLPKTPRVNFFPAKFSSSNVKAVALPRAPESVGENHNISFEATFTLSLAGHIDMFLFLSLVSAYCSGECCSLPSHSLACCEIVFS